jgi:hypothetical protein
MNAYPHLKNIQISPFENSTTEPELAQNFQNYMVNKFQSDGRLRISTIDPDSRIEGTILDYTNDIFSYDMNGNISEYRVSLLLSITMTDLRQQNVMYENKSLLVSEQYSTNPSSPNQATSETEALEKVFEKTFDTLIRSTLEAW